MTPVLALLVVLTGSLTGQDGRPLTRGEVHLVLPGADAPLTSATAAPDGSFTLRTDHAGLAFVNFSGADHKRRTVAVFLGKSERIALDVRLRANDEGIVKFAAPGGFDARFARIHEDMLRRRDKVPAARRAHKAAGKPPHTFAYDWSKDLEELTRAIAAEKNRTLRQALLASYLDLGVTADGARLATPTVEKALAEIEPASMWWSIDPALLPTALRYSKSEGRHAAYIRQAIEHHPDASLRKMFAKTISPSRRIKAGNPVPAFRVASYDDPGVTYTPEALRGKVYVIDFWATYCAPCLEELPNMNRMYAKYKARGFEVLSLSLDAQRETVNKFRQAGWKMPWLNAILEGGTSHPLVKEFEIVGIPRAILVGRDGVILATDADLRGRNLERTLARVMGAR